MTTRIQLSILFATIINTMAFPQIYFQEKIITDSLKGPESVYLSDLNGDGYLDVLSASPYQDKVVWYKNETGLGHFELQSTITTMEDGAKSVLAKDLDGDGDLDVLSSSSLLDRLVWYENLDGLGTFSLPQIITDSANLVDEIYAEDLDGDGDLDVLSHAKNRIDWYENLDGLGTFSVPHNIITTINGGGYSIYLSDLDGDDDFDILSSSYFDENIAWFENLNGQGNFGSEQIISSIAEGVTYVYAQDLDGDGDKDILSAYQLNNKIAWHENLTGQGIFGGENIITFEAETVQTVFASDLDNDGDMDVLSVSLEDDKIALYENMDGQGNFDTQQIISTNYDGPTSVMADDIDGDGDMDVIVADNSGNGLIWFKNLSPVATKQGLSINFNIYPIPTNHFLTIDSPKPVVQIDIYNSLGEFVISKENETKIDLRKLPQGVYFCIITHSNNEIIIRKIIIN